MFCVQDVAMWLPVRKRCALGEWSIDWIMNPSLRDPPKNFEWL